MPMSFNESASAVCAMRNCQICASFLAILLNQMLPTPHKRVNTK